MSLRHGIVSAVQAADFGEPGLGEQRGRFHHLHPLMNCRDIARCALLQQQFRRLYARFGMKSCPHLTVEQDIGDGHDGHALMMCHVSPNDGDFGAVRDTRTRVVERFMKAVSAARIEDALGTVVRQIAFYRFERRFHAARAKGEVSASEIASIWVEVVGESLGPAMRLNRGYGVYWSYVSHFVHTPFYVYAYAFGNLLVEALMEARRQNPAGFAPLYESLLAAGGSRTYVEAMAPFGLDPREPAFWAAGCARLERLVDSFEALV